MIPAVKYYWLNNEEAARREMTVRPIAFLTAFLSLLAFTSGAGAAPPEYSGGINNEYVYEEVVFISGMPIKFIGEMKLTERERQNGKIITYNFSLTPEDRTLTGRLTRQVSYLVEYDQRGDKGQTVVRTSLQGIPKETIELNGNKYTLRDFQFSKADLIDNRPAADFYSGNISGRKLYQLDNGRGKVQMEFSGGSVGYENFWGRTETLILDYVLTGEELLPTVAGEFSAANQKIVVINFNQLMNQAALVKENFSSKAGGEITSFTRRATSVTITFTNNLADGDTVEISTRVTDVTGKPVAPEQRTLTKGKPSGERFVYNTWQGTYRSQVSDSMIKSMYYQHHEPALASFAGGYLRVIGSEMVAQYDFNLPRVNGGIKEQVVRNRGALRLALQMAPRLERLIVPKFRDVGGHWAEEDILKLYSLEVFDETNSFFIPDAAMTRLDFTKAVMRASNIRVTAAETQPVNNRRSGPQEVSPFKDVPVEHPDYRLVKNAVDKGIIFGMTPDLFMPGQFLTRAQAVTILIRALGFEHLAPNPGYITAFSDDRDIPHWARDSIYMAREIGLIKGDHQNRVNVNRQMTRAEASAMLVRFLEFLARDLQRDYRENILLYN
jgi:hypothetical protein